MTAAEVWALCSTEWNCVCTIETWAIRGEPATLPGLTGSQSQGCSKSLQKESLGGWAACVSRFIQPMILVSRRGFPIPLFLACGLH